MKRKLIYFVSSFALAGAFAFGVSYDSTVTTAQSCKGQCQRSRTACENTATTQAQLSQCKKAYQGCISSCK